MKITEFDISPIKNKIGFVSFVEVGDKLVPVDIIKPKCPKCNSEVIPTNKPISPPQRIERTYKCKNINCEFEFLVDTYPQKTIQFISIIETLIFIKHNDKNFVYFENFLSCPECNSNLRKNGFQKDGKQRFYCKQCNYRYTPSKTIPGMKFNISVILDAYAPINSKKISIRESANFLKEHHNKNISHVSIWKWKEVYKILCQLNDLISSLKG